MRIRQLYTIFCMKNPILFFGYHQDSQSGERARNFCGGYADTQTQNNE